MKITSLILVLLGLALGAQGQTVAFYHFDSAPTSGVVTDSGPNQLNGTVVGTVETTPGVIGPALDLTGDSDYISIPASPLLVFSNSWTVELFFQANVPYTTYGSDASYLVVKQHTTQVGVFLSSFGISFSSSGHVYGETASALNAGTFLDSGADTLYNDGQWHHVALVFNANAPSGDKSLALYVDYVQRALAHDALPPTAWGNLPVYLGAGNFPGGQDNGPFRRNFDGKIDEVRISNAALEPSGFVRLQTGRLGLLAIEKAGAAVRVSWPSTLNKTYQLQYRPELTVGNWLGLGGPFSGTGTNLHLIDPLMSDQPARFYQVIESP